MIINSSTKQITLYFDPKTYKGKQTLVYAMTHNLAIAEVDITKSPFTGTQLLHIAKLLDVSLQDLADTGRAHYKKLMGKADFFDTEDWITVLTIKPELIRSPIAIKGSKAIVIESPTDILRL
jgi:arsenate reductase